MPRGPSPAWSARKQPVLDDYIWASVQQSGGLGNHHPQTGHYGTLVITGLSSREEAKEYHNALYRCAHYLNRHGTAPLSMHTDKPVQQADGTWSLSFRAIDKTIARQHVLAKYGNDRSKWPYDPRRRGQ